MLAIARAAVNLRLSAYKSDRVTGLRAPSIRNKTLTHQSKSVIQNEYLLAITFGHRSHAVFRTLRVINDFNCCWLHCDAAVRTCILNDTIMMMTEIHFIYLSLSLSSAFFCCKIYTNEIAHFCCIHFSVTAPTIVPRSICGGQFDDDKQKKKTWNETLG